MIVRPDDDNPSFAAFADNVKRRRQFVDHPSVDGITPPLVDVLYFVSEISEEEYKSAVAGVNAARLDSANAKASS